MTTGADLVAQIRAAAHRAGVPLERFAAPLSPNVSRWLCQTEAARQPKPYTIQRVNALLAGLPVPPPPPSTFQHQPRRDIMLHVERGPALDDAPAPVDREPCWQCGIRADLGCRHRATS